MRPPVQCYNPHSLETKFPVFLVGCVKGTEEGWDFVYQNSFYAGDDGGYGRDLCGIDNMMGHLVEYGNGIYLAVRGDGTLFTAGEYEPAAVAMAKELGGFQGAGPYVQGYYWDDWKPWTNLLAVYAMSGLDYGFFVGLKQNGRTVESGYNGEGQCDDINSWYGVKSVVFFLHNAVGLTYSGTLLCSGRLKDSGILTAQEHVKKVCPGDKRVSILKEAGTVSIFELNQESVFVGEIENSLEGIDNIFSYADRTYAVHRDGRVLIIGESEVDEAVVAACAGIQKIISAAVLLSDVSEA